MKRALSAGAFALVYLAALGHAGVIDVAMAVALGLLLSRGVRPERPSGRLADRLAGVPPLVVKITSDVAKGTWRMISVVLGVHTWRRLGVVEVPIGERSDLGVTVSGIIAMLSPGTLLLDVDRGRGVMVFHVIDASDPEAVREEIDAFYRRYQRRVFP